MKTLTNFSYHHVLVLGLAKSGTAAAQLLLDSGVNVRINDLKADKETPEVRELMKQGAEVITGGHPLSVLDQVDYLVKNPGIPYDNPIIAEAEKRNIPVVTEVELAGLLHEGPLVAVTGSNGKTTTTTLIHEMIKSDHQKVSLAGNIGHVSCEVARNTGEDETMVTELSSFQLLGTEKFRPDISVWLNLYEAHLDYHHSLENYHQAKAQITANQTPADTLVYNADDENIVKFLPDVKAKLVPFSIHKKGEGAWSDETSIYFENERIMDKQDILLVGEQNLQNILAAVATVKVNGIRNEAIQDVLKTFAGVEHRLQFVTKKNDRLFYNDSKATNILATSYALKSFENPVILLAGGLDRGTEFDSLIPHLNGVKSLVVFGETADLLIETANKAGIQDVVKVETMNEAVQEAYKRSEEEDVILLSPACASWDQYRTFEERGHMFIQAVHKL
ncbi:UDP-N-acetylmuramoyl-L-alanine--D-glutamate ligase [Halobacillus karajensis]|uniref:UDP-N-acetylmuramoylalanine--D-glutamate ligase n=1 Tax=Halobacillus karajensis TaxID=195088 RepID=A0A024P303_9BACI|nr:UDP-N-acetylmuramoyl-L-alanine--D-glutamate ligase [Halobacillus karajensis]CDQ19841.1 UDP-N-acetylmuramoylalanine--D-glutamate ligase [Halobacillus karajensis]CDQ22301.1 UDP-N-acetylmuramoylalanine--D-glutamate ligase [Halobacillus karajensis]CDQ28142.1 UDP-N-acetylmuramoylalanine--D-glutamate ligase [Halobacillus karajensis]